jgi:hypothetical protein
VRQRGAGLAYEQNLITGDSHGLCLRHRLIHGDHAAIGHDDICTHVFALSLIRFYVYLEERRNGMVWRVLMIGRLPILGVAAIMTAAVAAAQEREWSWGTSDTEAYLVFGVPESEDVGISFWCPIGSGEVRIFIADANASLAADIDTAIEFTAGETQVSVPARTMPNELDATTSAEGVLAADSPLLPAIGKVDRFIVAVTGESQTFPSAGQDIANLLDACRKR